jgi:hypothetical protein
VSQKTSDHGPLGAFSIGEQLGEALDQQRPRAAPRREGGDRDDANRPRSKGTEVTLRLAYGRIARA